MQALDTGAVTDAQRPSSLWVAALLHALAREEAAGRRRPALTEPKLDTWRRFRGRLNSGDLVSLLFEDSAVLHRVPFDPEALGEPLRPERVPESVTDAWLKSIESLRLDTSGHEYILEQARLLGLPTKLARSDLHVVKAHQRVLELPGTGGQLAHHLVSSQKDVTLQDNFVIACGSWQELTLAGVIALELGAPRSDFITRAEGADLKNAEHPLRQRSFDFVIGLHPDKGGLFRVDNQLAIWFPTAKVLLV